MFENLQERIEGAFKSIKGQGKITELNVAETIKEIRRALVDADVNYKIAKEFTDKVREEAMGQKAQAEAEGLDKIFRAAGADWREPGCSMCLAMNPDKLAQGERSASTSNRNFEGRQGRGGRTHLVSPGVAAATAVAGHFTTPEDLS